MKPILINNTDYTLQINDGAHHSVSSVNVHNLVDEKVFQMNMNSIESLELEVLTHLLYKQNKFYDNMTEREQREHLGIQLRLSITGLMHTLDYIEMSKRNEETK